MKKLLKNNHQHFFYGGLGLLLVGNGSVLLDGKLGVIIGTAGIISMFLACFGQRIK